MGDALKGQVTRAAADVYEEFFVPVLFAEWSPRVASAARIRSDERVLDVACGTGVLAREIVRRVGRGNLRRMYAFANMVDPRLIKLLQPVEHVRTDRLCLVECWDVRTRCARMVNATLRPRRRANPAT